MNQIKIVIEKTDDLYSAYAENVEGVYGGGETVAEAKQSIVEAIQLLKEFNQEENVPAALKGEYELVYKFDAQSLLSYFKGILGQTALAHLTGINARLLQHYASGLKKPRQPQAKKIEAALHKLGSELMAVEL